ncbi:MAG: thioredoxin domain-containing protein, partial [Candidatus Aenigmarchaeota archaeon]|nr:thioredoxin domain-containing protein [Candidatus Aenigmarchaeota archaeon]
MADHVCTSCGKAFSHASGLGQHAQAKHPEQYGQAGAPNRSRLLAGKGVIVAALALLAAIGILYGASQAANGVSAPSGAQASAEDPANGDGNATVTIVGYEDFQCPFCQRFDTQILPQIEAEYIKSGKVRFVFKDFPPALRNPSYHPQSLAAHQAAGCAGEQG